MTDATLSIVPTVLLVAGLSLTPFVVVLATSFTKATIVLSMARLAMGTGSIPSNTVITGLACAVTFVIMMPVIAEVSFRVEETLGNEPTSEPSERLIANISVLTEPWIVFLDRHTGHREKVRFQQLVDRQPRQVNSVLGRLAVLLPAFLLSELRAGFQFGFQIFLPFLVIDVLVANVLLALGMQMVQPASFSIPLKILLFVTLDGWSLLSFGLIDSYA